MNFWDLKNFYKGKRILVTGHTGFKGSWFCKMLTSLEADVYGYALKPPREPNIYSILKLDEDIHSTIGDIRNFNLLLSCFEEIKPDIVFHLAAQPIVRESYKIPRDTYEINVMGTVNLLECLRLVEGTQSFLNITTDKVYENCEIINHSFQEDEKLDGFDPYSNSKSCSELVTHSYANSFFDENKHILRISTARAGNVIGGGDFAEDRIVPDCVRAAIAGRNISVRNPNSIRPYQHVLEPLYAYLLIAMRQVEDNKLAGYYNVGPEDADCITTGELADYFVYYWGDNCTWKNVNEKNAPHEANFLKLNCNKIRKAVGWKPVWHVEEAVRETVIWYKAWSEGADMRSITERQIQSFLNKN